MSGMEKLMSVEDKIRRAEEIYYRRKNQEMPKSENRKESKKEKKNIKLFKKMIKIYMNMKKLLKVIKMKNMI